MQKTEQPLTNTQLGSAASTRLVSLDALRGFDMFWILGADGLVQALNHMAPNWATHFLATQLDHVAWNGFHFYDLIFPLFVFIVGVSLVFSLTKLIQKEGRASALKRVFLRGCALYLLGIFYYGGFSKVWPNIRMTGVLPLIAAAYFFAGLAFCFLRWRGLAALYAGLLLGYWLALAWVPFPDVRPVPGGDLAITKETGFTNVAQLNLASTNLLRGVYLPGVNLANYVDQKYLPGFKWNGTWDPEGMLAVFPATAACLLGVLAGLLLQTQTVPDRRKVQWLLAGGAVAVVVGFTLNLTLPIIKSIWSSSFVVVAGGYSAILLGVFYWVVDLQQHRRWCQPLVWIGMNPITLYLACNLLNDYKLVSERLVGGDIKAFLENHLAQGSGELVVTLTSLLVAIWLARFLHMKKIFLRV